MDKVFKEEVIPEQDIQCLILVRCTVNTKVGPVRILMNRIDTEGLRLPVQISAVEEVIMEALILSSKAAATGILTCIHNKAAVTATVKFMDKDLIKVKYIS